MTAIRSKKARVCRAGLTLWLLVALPPGALAATPPASAIPPPAATAAPGAMTDIHDIQPPVPIGFDAPWLMPALLALAVAVLLAILWWWWHKRRKPNPMETIVPGLPPEMVALQALDRIGDLRGQDGRAFYFQLSAVLRQYVFGRFGVGAPEMTAEEFLPCVDRLPIDRELARRLKALCRAMEPVKFAGDRTEEKQMEQDLFFIRGFVRQTAQREEVAEDADAGEPHDEVLRIEENPK
jgi:hypothetical protein